MSHHSSNNTSDIPLLTAPFLHYIPTSPPSQELDFHLPSRTPLHGLTVSEWAGSKTTRQLHNLPTTFNNNSTNLLSIAQHLSSTTTTTTTTTTATTTTTTTTTTTANNTNHSNKPIVLKDSTEDNWKDVYRNIKCMDQLYDASFYSWLKSEENVLVTAMYLHRIANEYPLVRIINALKWLISDWRLESISTLVRHVTVDWCDEAGDLRRAHLLRHLTQSWATQYTTTLITMVLSSAPYTTTTSYQRERFLRAFTKEWDFSKLSEFFMYLQSPANIDYKVKCVMLQEAARRERETLSAKLRKKRTTNTDTLLVVQPPLEQQQQQENKKEKEKEKDTSSSTSSSASACSSTGRRHHRRTSSNDVNDIKRLRLSTPDLDQTDNNNNNNNNNSAQPSNLSCASNSSASTSASSSSSASSSNSRRSASPDHHHNHHSLRNNNTTGMSSELSHLHLTTNTATTTTATTTRRRRSSSIISNESDDPMDTSNNNKKRGGGGPSSTTINFAEENL